jgi:peptidoglycan/LPS O-acetylase OafA/YrhL
MRRTATLDISRGAAALIVFLSHFLTQDQHFHLSPKTTAYHFFELSHFCVLYFFTLSGFVLTQSLKGDVAGASWLYARLIRLYPVYLACWLIPYLGLRLLGSSEIQLDGISTILGVLGLQSWSFTHYLDGPNSPLWSLSVEIALSIFFIAISRIRHVLLFLTLVVFIAYLDAAYGILPVFSGLPYFILGITIAVMKINYDVLRRLRFLLLTLFLFLCLYLPIQYPGILNARNPLFSIPAAISVLLSCLSFKFPDELKKFAGIMGTRSFALYACHVPILWLYKRIVFGPTKNQFIEQANIFYFLGGLFLVLIGTEILYRTVDTWAISISRKVRSKSDN